MKSEVSAHYCVMTRGKLFLGSHCFVALYFSQKGTVSGFNYSSVQLYMHGFEVIRLHKDVGQCACMHV